MTYTERTETGWFSRLGGALKGILLGLLFFAAGTVLLFWNEGRTVKTGDSIAEARAVTVPVTDVSRLNPELDGKVIHASGRAETADVLVDPFFGVNATAIRLSRKVEYYQWVETARTETRKKAGGSEEKVTTYTYAKEWVGSPVDSSVFRDENYKTVNFAYGNFEDTEDFAPTVTFGAYVLPQFMKVAITGAVPLETELSDERRLALEKSVSLNSSHIRAQNNIIYLGANPFAPEVGDVRVTFTQVPPAEVSIVAKVTGNTFEPFIASNGYSFSRLNMGRVSAENMFAGAEEGNAVLAWVLRVVGALVVIAGLGMVLRPLSVLADVVPFFGNLVGMGTGLIAGLVGAAWSCLIIAVAWVRFRPLLAVSLAGAAVVLVVLAFIARKGGKPVKG